MNFAALFILFTIGGFLIHYRPDRLGGTWDFVLFISAIICCAYLIWQIGASNDWFRRRT